MLMITTAVRLFEMRSQLGFLVSLEKEVFLHGQRDS